MRASHVYMQFFLVTLLTKNKNFNFYFFNWSWTRGSSSSLRAIGPGGPGIIAAEKKNKKRFDSSARPVVIRSMTQRSRKLDKKQHKLNRAS